MQSPVPVLEHFVPNIELNGTCPHDIMGYKMSKRLTLSLLLVCLILQSTVAFLPAQAASITIIVPTDYPTIQQAIDYASSGDTVFVKTGTYEECVSINKSLSLIGEDKTKTTIKGDWGLGGTVILVDHDDVTVSGFTIQSNAENTHGTSIRGVHLLNVHGCTVSSCIFSRVGKGIWLYGSSGNTIEDNSVYGLQYFTWSGITLEASSNNSIRNNSFIDSMQGGIEVLSHSCGNSITGNTVKSQWAGINFEFSSNNNTVTGNSLTGVRYGVWLQITSSYNIIKNNTIRDSLTGIQANGASSNNLIEKNTITHSDYCGIEIHNNSSPNRVIANNITGNTHGIEIKSSTNNTLKYNNITGSSKVGAIFDDSSNNLIQENNFAANTLQISTSSSSNTWDAEGKGNYWDNYNNTDNGNNAQYFIDESNIDHYPLINPVNYPNTANPGSIEIKIPSSSPQTFAAVVFGTLLCLLLCIGGFLFYRKHRRISPIKKHKETIVG
jgi:parallel beta-helix repeat protein